MGRGCMAFLSVLLMNAVFTILLCVACGLLLAGIILLFIGFKLSKSGKKKGGRICKIIGAIVLGVLAVSSLSFFWDTIFPKHIQFQTPSGSTVSVRESDCALFMEALNRDDSEAVKQMLNDNPDFIYYGFQDRASEETNGKTLLGYTISQRLDYCTLALLDFGLAPDCISTEETDDGAISLFIQNCNNIYATDWELQVISALLDYGADINKTAGTEPPLHFIVASVKHAYASPEQSAFALLQKCVDAGADLNAQNEAGQTAAEYYEALDIVGTGWRPEDQQALLQIIQGNQR